MKNDLYEQRIKIISAFLIAAFIGLFNETALNMAIAQLIVDFNSDAPTIQWLTTGYLLTLGVLVPISAILMQRFTTRQLFTASLLFSMTGTVIAAISPTFTILLMGRIIQAAGTAIILPLMMQVILLVYPINKRGAAMGKIGLVIVFAPAIGPTIAGLVIDQLSWHFIFWLSLPFLVLAFLIGLKFIQNVSEVKPMKFDIMSIVLSTLGFGGIVYGFSISGKLGTFMTAEVLVAVCVGLLALVLFGFRQLKMEQPMLNLRVFTFRMYSLGVTLVMICMMMILSTMVLLPIYLQNILLLTPVIAGLVLLPGGVINAFMSVVAGNMFDRFGPRVMVPAGLFMSLVALFALRTIDGTTSVYFIIAFHIIMFIGISLTMMPAQTNGLNQLPTQMYPDGTAIMNTLQQVAGAVGTAVAVTIMSISTANYVNMNGNTVAAQLEGSIQGVQNSITFGLIIAVVGFALSLLLRNVRQEK
ncbi:MAG TPA: DHA2 family efflux MFS transporter permease subunit [Sporosarcina psychrophila]|uniref:DHA2 family efflux MFS transporter permease subunit n=1 Tax=Sporosarcina psychrophila TaxID=1476 RepID=A0A921G4Z7_SPOPS|nr:DHA2 family efflux MFS transporter permease subunit [Sporosarcina psychrophila]